MRSWKGHSFVVGRKHSWSKDFAGINLEPSLITSLERLKKDLEIIDSLQQQSLNSTCQRNKANPGHNTKLRMSSVLTQITVHANKQEDGTYSRGKAQTTVTLWK